MPWPFDGVFTPLSDSAVEIIEPKGPHTYRLHVMDLGALKLNSGRLLACDPFVTLPDGVVIELEPGTYPVRVTMADVSEAQDGSHLREAYLSLVLTDAATSSFVPLVPTGKEPPKVGEFYGVSVDAGAVAFVDELSARTLMPPGDWYNEIFDSGRPDSWFAQVDAGSPLPTGCANITLPLARDGENVVISHSGWGDGFYPVVGAYDNRRRLTGVHIDLQVVGDFRE